MVCTLLRFAFLLPALLLVLLFVLPAGLLAALFYILALIFDDRRPSYYHTTR